jgi:small subunit ribosomal protein S2
VTLHELIDAGMHYGHHASRWNPKMKPYIFGKRNFIHIINLRETLRGLITASRFITQVVASGKMVVFVGTKRQARRTVREQALRCGMPYVAERWLGGTLTNFRTIRSRLDRLFELEGIVEGPEIDQYTKKEGARLKRELSKIRRNLDGIRSMDQLPGALVTIDPRREKIAVAEAKALRIPTVGLADTDCDPDTVDVLIPGNDDAMRAVEVTLRCIGDAVLAGKEKRRDLVRAEATAPVSAGPPPAKTGIVAAGVQTPEPKPVEAPKQ